VEVDVEPKGEPIMFLAYEVAVQIIRALRPIVAAIRRFDPDLARQIVRSANSVVLNVAEGNRRVGKDRLHLFRIAEGETSEIRGGIDAAEAWGWIGDASAVRALLDRELGLLWGLTHSRRAA
jgi:four helix bundle protein